MSLVGLEGGEDTLHSLPGNACSAATRVNSNTDAHENTCRHGHLHVAANV